MQEIQTEKKNTSHSNQLQSYQLKPQGPVKENQYVNVHFQAKSVFQPKFPLSNVKINYG